MSGRSSGKADGGKGFHLGALPLWSTITPGPTRGPQSSDVASPPGYDRRKNSGISWTSGGHKKGDSSRDGKYFQQALSNGLVYAASWEHLGPSTENLVPPW